VVGVTGGSIVLVDQGVVRPQSNAPLATSVEPPSSQGTTWWMSVMPR